MQAFGVMKGIRMNQEPEKDERLDEVLREWVVDAPLPPRFQEQVWSRISRAKVPPASLWSLLTRFMEAVLPRPKVTFAYLSMFLGLGVAAGSLTAQIKTNRVDTELSHRYVQSLDPYRADMSHQ